MGQNNFFVIRHPNDGIDGNNDDFFTNFFLTRMEAQGI
jgi:hypothetical protein